MPSSTATVAGDRQAHGRAFPASSPSLPARLAVPVFVFTTLVGATLVFLVQPMAVKALLPAFGGSAAVWNTAMVFFQGALLVGYLYAYGTGRGRTLLPSAVTYVALTVVAVIWFSPEPVVAASSTTSPAVAVLGLLALSLGLPFIVVAAAGPLLQRWFSTTGHHRAHDPYFLYAAGNVGSLGGLLLYPVLIEPQLTIPEQFRLWRIGMAIFAMALVACAALVARSSAGIVGRNQELSPRVPWGRRLTWLGLAAAPSSLLLGATSHIGADIASAPLLWILPLALYLVTFIVAFGRHSAGATRGASLALPALALLAILNLVGIADVGPMVQLVLHLSLLTAAGLACHGRLAGDRPAPDRLTEFYLCLSLGGVVGGSLTALIAPQVFNEVLEYPLAVAAVVALAPAAARTAAAGSRAQLAAAAFAVAAAAVTVEQGLGLPAGVGVGTAALLPLLGQRRAQIGVLGVGAALVVLFNLAGSSAVLHQDRTFYGVHRVVERSDGTHLIVSGTTVHGAEHFKGDNPGEPVAYYHDQSPVADVLRQAMARGAQDVGVVGVGAGSLAAYSRPGQRWTFFDIDPSIARTAQDPGYFSYLDAAAGDVDVLIKDGRLGLQAMAPASLDVIVLDAFSSDAIPVHLLTREAMQTYAAKLRPGGVIAIHVTNRHLHLAPTVGAAGHAAGLTGLEWSDRSAYTAESDRYRSHWIVLAPSGDDLEKLALDDRWNPVEIRALLWTDDFSNVWNVIRWGEGLRAEVAILPPHVSRPDHSLQP